MSDLDAWQDGDAVAASSAPVALLAVFGTPSTLMHYGIHLVREIAGVMRGLHEVVHGNFLAEFSDLGQDPSAGPSHRTIICTSDVPEAALCRFFALAAVPMLVFVDDVDDIIDDVVAAREVAPVDALRLATRSLCTLQALLAAPGVALFGTARLDAGLDRYLDDLLAALRMEPTPTQREDIRQRLGGVEITARDHFRRLFPVVGRRRSSTGRSSDDARGNGPMPIGVKAVDTVAANYADLAAGRPPVAIEWPASIFSDGDAAGEPLGGPCEMIGPARTMVYGPYLHLPGGDWAATIVMEVVGNESGNRLRVEVVNGVDVLTAASADMPAFGHYSFTLSFTMIEPTEPVELRFQIESGAIEGRLLLHRVVMAQTPATAPGRMDRTAAVYASRRDAPLTKS